jgi:hypothetical protein
MHFAIVDPKSAYQLENVPEDADSQNGGNEENDQTE